MGSTYSIEELQEDVYGLKFEVDRFNGTIASKRYSKLQNKLIQANARILKLKKFCEKEEAQECDRMLKELSRCLEFLTRKVTQDQTPFKEETPPSVAEEEAPPPRRRKRDPVETLNHYQKEVATVEEEIEQFLQDHDPKQRLLIEGKLKLLYTDLTIIKIEGKTPLDARRNILLQRLMRCYKQMKKDNVQEGGSQQQESDIDSDFDSDFDSEVYDTPRSNVSGEPSVNSTQDINSTGTTIHNFYDENEVIYENIDVIREYLASRGISSKSSADKEHEQHQNEEKPIPKHPRPLPMPSQESHSKSDLEDEDYVESTNSSKAADVTPKEAQIEKKTEEKPFPLESAESISDNQEKPTPVPPKPIGDDSNIEWSSDSDSYIEESDISEHLHEQNEPNSSKYKQLPEVTAENSSTAIEKSGNISDEEPYQQEQLDEQPPTIHAPVVKFPEQSGFSDSEIYYEDSSEDERLEQHFHLKDSSDVVLAYEQQTVSRNSCSSFEDLNISEVQPVEEIEASSRFEEDSDNNSEYCSAEETEDDAQHFYETVNPAISNTENSYKTENELSQPLNFILEENDKNQFQPTIKRKDSDSSFLSDADEQQYENHPAGEDTQEDINLLFGKDNRESIVNQKLVDFGESNDNPTEQPILQEAKEIPEEVNVLKHVKHYNNDMFEGNANLKEEINGDENDTVQDTKGSEREEFSSNAPKLLNAMNDLEVNEAMDINSSEDNAECSANTEENGITSDQCDTMPKIETQSISYSTKNKSRITKESKTGLIDYTQEINKIVEAVKELKTLNETFKETEDYTIYGLMQEKLMKTIKAMFNINTVNFDKKSLVLYEIVSKDIQMFVNEL